MWLAFLDEFGNQGFLNPTSNSFHPAFGYAGLLIKASQFDELSRNFLLVKANLISDNYQGPAPKGTFNLNKLGRAETLKIIYERKSRTVLYNRELESGSSNFRKKQAHRTTNRLFNLIESSGGKIFLHGYEKKFFKTDGAKPNLMLDTLDPLIKHIHSDAKKLKDEIVIFFDRHQLDKENKRTDVISSIISDNKYHKYVRKYPSFSDSKWSQGIQIADWICFLAGKIMGQYCANPHPSYKHYRNEYGNRFRELLSENSFFQCQGTQQIRRICAQLPLPLEPELPL
ncbi:MAG: hypothetical protein FD176_1735 [Rhodospirillaceae bacterium]|nr:MAG: hypothetical protein FD176_1735 [Rhodospirillaceae bacterium]TNC96278.1 MAG: hypothetical protein FD119_1878 [Stygiobacter sp.]